MPSVPRDDNRVPGLLAESNDPSRDPINLLADAITQRLLVNATITGNVPITNPDGSNVGGGSQFAEDAAHITGDFGTMSLAVRNDAQVSRTSANADYSAIAVDDVGRPIVASAAYSTRIDEALPTVTYIGTALCGSATNAAVWQIKKIDSAIGTSITFADGDPQFNNIWNDRATLTYS